MEYALIAITVLIGAGLTFFSGFGLGTIMLPVFSLFFDLPVAVGATAIVHLANNVFKFMLVSKHIHRKTYFRFGLPAMAAAALGSWLLAQFADFKPLYSYVIADRSVEVTLINVVIGFLMICFAWFDLKPSRKDFKVSEKHLPLGGILSGFFGGISGHQGAFRSVFLSKANLTKEQFIGTGNAVSLTIDLARVPIYLGLITTVSGKERDLTAALTDGSWLLIVGIVFAFLGTYFGKKLVAKTTIKGVQKLIGILLFIMGGLLITGLI